MYIYVDTKKTLNTDFAIANEIEFKKQSQATLNEINRKLLFLEILNQK